MYVMHQRKGLAHGRLVIEIVAMQAFAALQGKLVLPGDPLGVDYLLSHHVAHFRGRKIDQQGAAAAETAAALGTEGLRDFDDKVGAYVAVGADATHRPHGMNLDLAKLALDAGNLERLRDGNSAQTERRDLIVADL